MATMHKVVRSSQGHGAKNKLEASRLNRNQMRTSSKPERENLRRQKKKIKSMTVNWWVSHRQRDSCDPLPPDGRQLPVDCLEIVLVGELAPVL